MTVTRSTLPGFLALLTLTACDNPFTTECTMEARWSLRVTVVDSVSGRNLAPDAIVRVRDGDFVHTLWHGFAPIYLGPAERPGTYEIVAEHAGYLDWRMTGVRVRKDRCHVVTRDITARMVPRS